VLGWISAHARWLLLIIDPEDLIRPATELLAAKLRISNREAEFVSLLALGCDLRTATQRLHTHNHHRTHSFEIDLCQN